MSKDFFRVDASLMQQLGASLIADDLQCIVELIKNAYDADARLAKVIIDAPQRIIVEDNGHGMDRESISRGWLTISNSVKLEQKQRGELSAQHKRTPLGDKGLGRLSTQRLGNRLRIETVSQGSGTLITVDIDWSQFKPGVELMTVPVDIKEEVVGNRPPGTKVIITDLLNASDWQKLAPKDLRLSLASLVSPYSEIASFRLQAYLNGVEVSPDLLASNLRQAALQQFRFHFDNEQLQVSGLIRPLSFRSVSKKAQEDYANFFEPDRGAGFLKFLLEDRRSKAFSVSEPSDSQPGTFCAFSLTRAILDIANGTTFRSPGPFSGEVDAFSLDSHSAIEIAEFATLDSTAEARQLVREMSGIRVYRDGFIVRTDHDWLKLGEGQTRGGSWYGLKPFNTMGYVAISARDNLSLLETTDRQGFVENAPYRGFLAILNAFTKSANDILEHVRRRWNDYVKVQQSNSQGLTSRDPRVIEERIQASYKKVDEARQSIQKASKLLATITATDADSLFPVNPKTSNSLLDAQDLITEATESLSDVSRSIGLSGLLVSELEALNARLGEVYELVSLGITAEALSHDISNIIDRLSSETRSVQKHSKGSKLEDLTILRYFEIVRSTVNALEKQLGHLDPALRYTRERRESFTIFKFLEDSSDYYRTRLENANIELRIRCDGDFSVRMNRGKLIQVLDNLVLNSEYWVKRFREESKSSAWIEITVGKPEILVQDSAKGVESAFEETLFEPFVTSKPKAQGRGLGLFISRQLLDLDGCTLELKQERNSFGRRYKFAINLSGVLENG